MNLESALFGSWAAVGRVALTAVLAYLALILLLRTSGKRTTSKLNIFDWVVTVALGSTLATIVLSRDVPLVEGLTAFVTLIGLQALLSWLAVRSSTVRGLIKADPSLLYYRGEFLRDRMRSERVTEEEIRSAVRNHGHGSLESIEAVILETNADLSVVTRMKGDAAVSAMQDVSIPQGSSPSSA